MDPQDLSESDFDGDSEGDGMGDQEMTDRDLYGEGVCADQEIAGEDFFADLERPERAIKNYLQRLMQDGEIRAYAIFFGYVHIILPSERSHVILKDFQQLYSVDHSFSGSNRSTTKTRRKEEAQPEEFLGPRADCEYECEYYRCHLNGSRGEGGGCHKGGGSAAFLLSQVYMHVFARSIIYVCNWRTR